MKNELTYSLAKRFVDNYKGINDPTSLNYCDSHAIVWLEDQARKYGYDRISTMNAACRIFMRNNKPAKRGKKIRIEIVKYMAKWGAFASGESEMYRADLVGANGKRQTLPDTRACCTEYEGNPERKYAEQIAKIWAGLLGCQIVSVDKIAKKGL
jgi:hypothetical protein